MNKNFLILLSLAVAATFSSCSNSDDKTESSELMAQLPEKAQSFVRSSFAGGTLVEVERNLGNDVARRGSSYEATLRMKGVQIDVEFDAKGNWTNIEADDNAAIPTAVLSLLPNFPKRIIGYIAEAYPKVGINEVEQKAYGIEVELTNGEKLLFDKSGEFLKNPKERPLVDPALAPEWVMEFLNKYFVDYDIVYQKDVEDVYRRVTKYYIQKKGSYYESYTLVYNMSAELVRIEGDDDPMLPIDLKVVGHFSTEAVKKLTTEYRDYYVTELEIKGRVVKLEIEHKVSGRELSLTFALNSETPMPDPQPNPSPNAEVPASVKNDLATHFPGFRIVNRMLIEEYGVGAIYISIRNKKGLEYELIYAADGVLLKVEGDDAPLLMEVPMSVVEALFSPKISALLKEKYADYAATEIRRLSDEYGEEIQVELRHRKRVDEEKMYLVFDKHGNLVKQES